MVIVLRKGMEYWTVEREILFASKRFFPEYIYRNIFMQKAKELLYKKK